MSLVFNPRGQISCLVISTIACIGFLFDAQNASRAKSQLDSKLLKFEKARKDASINQQSNDQLAISRSATANRLSQELEVVCANTGVNLKQVQFETVTKPITATDGEGTAGWALNDATILLEGTAPQVFQALRQMGSGTTVYRLDKVAINRLVNGEGGVSGVSAEVKAAVLVRTEDQS